VTGAADYWRWGEDIYRDAKTLQDAAGGIVEGDVAALVHRKARSIQAAARSIITAAAPDAAAQGGAMSGIAVNIKPGLALGDTTVVADGSQTRDPTSDDTTKLGFVLGCYHNYANHSDQSFYAQILRRNVAYTRRTHPHLITALGLPETLYLTGPQSIWDDAPQFAIDADGNGTSPRPARRPQLLIAPAGDGSVDRITKQLVLADFSTYGPVATESRGKLSVSAAVTQSVEVGWSRSVTDSVSNTVEIGVEIGAIGLSAHDSETFEHSVEVGQHWDESTETDVGSVNELEFDIGPGDGVIAAVLTLTKGVLHASVPVQATLVGDVLADYGRVGRSSDWPYRNHYGIPQFVTYPLAVEPATYLMSVTVDFASGSDARTLKAPDDTEATINRLVDSDDKPVVVYP